MLETAKKNSKRRVLGKQESNMEKSIMITETLQEMQLESKIAKRFGGKIYYHVFTPTNFTTAHLDVDGSKARLPKEEGIKMTSIIDEHNKFQNKTKCIQALVLLFYPILKLWITKIRRLHVRPLGAAGIALMLMYTMHFGLFVWFFVKAHKNGSLLYRVYSLGGVIPQWTGIFLHTV